MSAEIQRSGTDLVARGLTLTALCSFALVGPLLDVLGRDATFFVAHGAGAADLIGLLIGLVLLPPLLLLGLEALAGLAGAGARRTLHLSWVGLLVALAVAPATRRLELAPGLQLGGLLVLGLAAALIYRAWAPARALLGVLSLAPLVFVAVFCLHPDIARIVRTGEALPLATPDLAHPGDVVLVIFDELPITTLMADEDHIDAVLFPNFARLAATSTWFRNATAVHDFTNHAVPAILTGRRPDEARSLPVASNHPRSLFTLLGATHRFVVRETLTAVCPQVLLGDVETPPFATRFAALLADSLVVLAHIVLPEAATAALPPVDRQWRGFLGGSEGPEAASGIESVGVGNVTIPVARHASGSRVGQFREFVAGIDARGGDTGDGHEPTLFVHHVMLPHMEWIYLPSGTMYLATRDVPGLQGGAWTAEAWPRTVAWQRHLLQTGLVDRLLGELLDALQATGRIDDATLVVTADHGVSFTPGAPQREAESGDPDEVGSPGNLDDIMRVPLFVKRPGQTRGAISDRNVEAIDIVPTFADVLGAEVPWPVDGRSVYAETQRPDKTMARLRGVPLTLPGTPPGAWSALSTKLEIFGSGATWADVFAVGDDFALVGRELSDLAVTQRPLGPGGSGAQGAQVHVEGRPRFDAVRTASGVLPALVEGYVTGTDIPEELAIATRGVVRAVAHTYARTPGRTEFVALLPEDALADGANDLQVLAVDADGGLSRMTSRPYRLEPDVLVLPDGRRLELAAEPGGLVHNATLKDSVLYLTGWAGDTATGRPADTVLVFQNGRYVDSGPTGAPISRAAGTIDAAAGTSGGSWNAGFELMIPPDVLAGPPDGRLAVIALTGEVARPLRLGPDASWIGP